jgi:hypothetical protein
MTWFISLFLKTTHCPVKMGYLGDKQAIWRATSNHTSAVKTKSI